ncbi:MAG: hypothetical protein LUQ65_15310 [Candidatus Helarchaeota archaeon]|nr:hypothetical protein [Candidatus Helarchaeota archaeon]
MIGTADGFAGVKGWFVGGENGALPGRVQSRRAAEGTAYRRRRIPAPPSISDCSAPKAEHNLRSLLRVRIGVLRKHFLNRREIKLVYPGIRSRCFLLINLTNMLLMSKEIMGRRVCIEYLAPQKR